MRRSRHNGGGRSDGRLWLLVLPIAAWGLHFLAVYASAAVYCAKTSAGAGFTAAKIALVAITIAALAALAVLAWRARSRYRTGLAPGGANDRFIGHTVLMLCALSALAVLAVASVAFFFGDCRR